MWRWKLLKTKMNATADNVEVDRRVKDEVRVKAKPRTRDVMRLDRKPCSEPQPSVHLGVASMCGETSAPTEMYWQVH